MWLIGAYFVWIICMWLRCALSFFEKSFAIIYCILCLCDLLQTLTFPIIYEHSLSRSFLIATLYYEVGHPTQNICECNAKSYSRRCILSKKNSLFFFYGFLSGALFLFVSFQMFWCTLVFTPTDSILKHENDVLKKIKLRKVYIY